MSTLVISRYPGARPFADDPNDQRLFYGRNEEIDTLFHRVCAARLLVLFGESGLGKTSLLQAGVFPKLRERHLLPIPVRINIEETPLAIIKSSASVACRNFDIDYTPGKGETLWEFFKTAMFWQGEILLTPVLVFDQFEEIFTLKNTEYRASLARELGDLFRGTLPPSVRQQRKSAASLAESLFSANRSLSEQPPNVRVILSLREDFLGALQELAADIPAIFDDRLRLSPLSKEQATSAICEPAGLGKEAAAGGEFTTPSFIYADDALAEILSFLRGKSAIIEPLQLQLVCRSIEEQVAQQQAKNNPIATFTSKELGGHKRLDEIVQNFYRQTIAKLDRRDRRYAKRLCEDGLLNAEGARLSLQENEILKNYKISKQALDALVNARLLRQEWRLESFFYELSHNNLAKPILASRPMKLTRKQRNIVLQVIGMLIVIILGGSAFLYYQQQQAEQAFYANEGNRFLVQGRLPQAQEAYVEYLHRVQNTTFGTNEITRRLSESVALDRLGDVLKARERWDDAQNRYQESLTIRQKLIEHAPSNNEWQWYLSNSYESLANIFLAQMQNSNDPPEQKKYGEEALEQFQKTKDIREHLVNHEPSNAIWQSDLSWVCGEISSVLFELDHYQEAAESAQCGVEHLVKQGDQANKETLAQAYGNLAWYELFNRNPENAIKASEKGLDRKADDEPTNNLLNIDLAHGYLFSGQYEKAKEIYLSNKDKKIWNGQSVRQTVLGNFTLFREHGINHADMKKIEILLH